MSRFRKKTQNVTIKKPLTKAEEALKIAKGNRKAIRTQRDFKVGEEIVAQAALNATPTVRFLIQVNIEGTKVLVKSVQVKGIVKQNLTSALIDDYRVDLVMDRYPDKAAITPLLYLGSATPKVLAFKDFAEKARYRILKTWSGYLSSSEGSNSFRKINYFKSLNITKTSDTINSISQTSIIRNALYLVFWTTATANQPTFEFSYRQVLQDGEG